MNKLLNNNKEEILFAIGHELNGMRWCCLLVGTEGNA